MPRVNNKAADTIVAIAAKEHISQVWSRNDVTAVLASNITMKSCTQMIDSWMKWVYASYQIKSGKKPNPTSLLIPDPN